MIGKLFHYSQYNKHRKDLPAENRLQFFILYYFVFCTPSQTSFLNHFLLDQSI